MRSQTSALGLTLRIETDGVLFDSATWFITGTSRGLGLELVTQLLERGDNVAATTRSTERLRAALDAHEVEAHGFVKGDRGLILADDPGHHRVEAVIGAERNDLAQQQ